MIKRLLPHPGLTGLLIVLWMLLLNDLTGGGALMAVLWGVTIPLLTAPFWPDRPQVRFGWSMVEYFAVVLWDIFIANFQVARLILFRRNRDLRSKWLVIPLDLRSPEAITTLAGTISLTPGTVSADISVSGRWLLVHGLDVPDQDAEIARIKSRYEARLMRIFR